MVWVAMWRRTTVSGDAGKVSAGVPQLVVHAQPGLPSLWLSSVCPVGTIRRGVVRVNGPVSRGSGGARLQCPYTKPGAVQKVGGRPLRAPQQPGRATWS